MRIRTLPWGTKNGVYGDAFTIIVAGRQENHTLQKVKTKRKKSR